MTVREYQLNNDWQNGVEYKPIAYDLAEDLMYFCVIYPALVLVNRFFDAGAGMYQRVFILFISMIAMTVNRRKSKRIYAFALILLAITVSVAFLPLDLPIKIEMLAAVLISAMASIGKLIRTIRRREYRNDPSEHASTPIFLNNAVMIFGICCIYVTYIVSVTLNAKDMIDICLAALVILVVTFMVYTHKTGTLRLVESNRRGDFFPWKIKRFNFLFTVFTVAFGIAIGFLTYAVVSLTGIGRIDGWLISLFAYTPAGTGSEPVPTADASSKIDFTNIPDTGNRSPSYIMEIFDKVLEVVFWIVLAIIILVIMLLLFRFLIKILKKSRERINEETRSILSIREVTDEVVQKVKKSKIATLFSGSSNRMKIRKLYYKLVKKYLEKGILISNTDTPAEIESKIEQSSGRNIHHATLIYQKARYSSGDCEKEDVERIKTELRQQGLK